jgi:uncharacterized membrane protein YcaP (DUF421 family)
LNIVNEIISILIWTSVPINVSYCSIKSKKICDVVEGKATTFIQVGKNPGGEFEE